MDPDLPERQVDETPAEPAGDRTVEQILVLPPDALLTEGEEQALRDHFGYTASDRRTRAERAGVAGRIVAQVGPPAESTKLALAELVRQEHRYQAKRKAYLDSLERKVPSPG